jgi:flagellar biosynthesis protein FlhG
MAVRRLEPDDQAAGLRRLLGERNACRPIGLFGPDPVLNASAAAGLAFALAARGARVCLIDEAPAPLNALGQLGLTPDHDLADVTRAGFSFDDVLVPTPDGPSLLRADRGLASAAETDDRRWSRLAEDFAAGEWEWLILSAPADERPSLALAAPRRILVLPAVKARLTEAYALLKAAHIKQPDATWQALFMNADDETRTEQLMAALNETVHQFLGIDITLLGVTPNDAKLDAAARAMRPLQEIAPAAPAALAFRQQAERLHDDPAAGMNARTFWQRMGLFGRLNKPAAPAPVRHSPSRRAYG